ncbi:MAG TPA: NAD-dependent epimerase/dehydratase family protein [Thermoanaerobaculia bacterium]|nr:NAD-dependent epimerase/dehydratase family protein [Thermoanaerobaculia bacterium]
MSGLDWRDLPVLVTGGAGFIGSHLVDALVERGARVRVLDDLSTGRRENLAGVADRIELVEGDVRDPETCRRAAAGVRVVLHQAALGSVPRSMADPATTIAVNVAGTANVFAAARDAGVHRVVYASSSSVYGDSPALPKREGEEGRPLSPYALSKAMDEELAQVFGTAFGLELVGLRYFNVYGPRQDPAGPYAAVVPRFFAACRAGEAPVIHGDGEQSRDFTYVADAVAANLLAAAAPAEACGRAYNVAGGRRTTINEIAAEIRRLTQEWAQERGGPCPEPVHADPREGDVRHSHADLTAAREALGYEPRVPLAEGLARTFEALT